MKERLKSEVYEGGKLVLQLIEEELTKGDRQLIEVNQLGAPQHIYRRKAVYIRLFRYLSIAWTLMVALFLVLFLWHKFRTGSWALYASVGHSDDFWLLDTFGMPTC